MFNIIFPIIIFVSLAVIVFIIGKHLPEFVDISKNKKNTEESKKNIFIKKILVFFKNSILWLFEKVIEKIGRFLALIHSWIVNNKKKKEEQIFDEKKEEELVDSESFFQKITKKKDSQEIGEKNNKPIIAEEKTKRENFFVKFKEKLKDKILEKKKKKMSQVFQEEGADFEKDKFSDGIVTIHEKNIQNRKPQKDKFINEVIEIKKESNMSLDEEIGVDRNILERKIIGKIVQNPRDRELYRQLGELYLKMQNYSDAEGCYKQILKISLRDIDAKRKIERIKLLKRSSKHFA